MAMRQSLTTKQTQRLAMTQELRNAIELLQFTQQEVTQFILAEIESNPLLNLDNANEGDEEASPTTDEQVDLDHLLNTTTPTTAVDAFDAGRETLDPNASFSDMPRHETTLDLIDTVSERISLREHLVSQIPLQAASSTEIMLAIALVDVLDSDGYLRTSLDELSEQMNVAAEDLEDALTVLQSCEPTGVGARSLGERFALQLTERGAMTPVKQDFLDRLDAVGNGGAAANLRKDMNGSCEMVDVLLAELRTLDPHPCASFETEQVSYIVPDVFVSRNNLGGWGVELNPAALPKVIFENSYAAQVGPDGDDAKFMKSCVTHGNWLIKALDQRAETILKVATEIVRVQHRFLSEGVSGMAPLTLAAVADAVKMHESTISRVTRGKFLDCPRGQLELRHFFSSGVPAANGLGTTSSLAVRDMVKRLIDSEPASKPLSDDAVTRKLKEDGIDIARRTVTKYRESLKIPSSVDRRRFHAAGLKLTS